MNVNEQNTGIKNEPGFGVNNDQSENVKVSVKDFLLRYLRYIPLFIISVSLFLAIAYIYLRYATPIYNSKATLLIKNENKSMGLGGTTMESMLTFNGSNNVQNEIEILKSLNLAKRVVRAINLQEKHYTIGKIKTTLIYPLNQSPLKFQVLKLTDTIGGVNLKVTIINEDHFTLNDDNTKVYNFGQTIENGEGVFKLEKNGVYFNSKKYEDYQLNWYPLESAGFAMLEGLKVSTIKDQTDILLISYQGIHPQLGRDIINQLMQEYNQSNIEDKNQITSKTISFINDRLNLIVNELGDVEKNLQQYKQENNVIDLGTQSKLFLEDLSGIDKQQNETEVKLNIIKYLRDYVNEKGNEYSIVPSILGVQDPTLNQLVSQYNEFQLQRATQLKSTTINNPLIVTLELQLEKLRIDIKENLKNVYNSTNILKTDLSKKSGEYRSSITSVPIKEKQLLEITRQQGIKQTLYLFLLQKREEAAISLASTISNSQIVDKAIASTVPIKPDHFNVKLMAVFVGLIFPLGFIYLKEILNDKVNNRGDIQKVTQAPIFGEIGHSQHEHPLVVKKNSRNIVSEQFRMIRSNLQYLVGKIEKPVILVTSTFSGEGKSFVSINVGAVMALAGKRTVILEFDIRKPKIASGLNLSRTLGITSYLVGNSELSTLPVQVPNVDGLYVIPCGPIPPNPAEMLLDPRISILFQYAKNNFDAVIIDTAPVGLVSDSLSLSQYADCTLYLVRLEYTLKKQIYFIDEIYRNKKLPRPAILVNDIKASGNYYSYGNYSGYGYGNSSNGYYDDEKRPASAIGKWWRKKMYKRRHRSDV